MEPKAKKHVCSSQEPPKVTSLLEELARVKTQLYQERAQREVLKQEHRVELEALVDERTQKLQTANIKLRMQMDERRKAEQQLYFEAHHDSLTKLPNRALFSDRLSYAIRHLKRHPDQRFSVLFIDLDRFKIINDTLGHHVGDLFLVEIAKRLRACVRDN